jgi:predicted RNA methylase
MIVALKQARNLILHCENDIASMKQAVDMMYLVYTSLSPVTITNQNDANIYLPSGKAISPSQAAHCLLEMKRTAMFLRGVNDSITHQLSTNAHRPIRVLYAGTGPYAALITPLLIDISPENLTVDLIDINPVSLQSAANVLKKLGLSSFVGKVHLADASTFQVDQSYDIVVSETMQAALKKEPQVAIMQNIIPQLPPHAIFIPQRITIDAVLSSRGKWNAETYTFDNVVRAPLGEVMQVNASHLGNYNTTLQLPEQPLEADLLQLHTTIEVYGKHLLTDGDCSLNQPIKVGTITNEWGKTIHCRYEQNDEPHVAMNIEGCDEWYALNKPKSFSLL